MGKACDPRSRAPDRARARWLTGPLRTFALRLPSVLATAWVLCTLGCGSGRMVMDVEPAPVRLSQATPVRTVHITNDGNHTISLSHVHFEGRNWDVFRIVDTPTPDRVPAHETTTLGIAVSKRALHVSGTDTYRDARAQLVFRLADEARRLDVSFAGHPFPDHLWSRRIPIALPLLFALLVVGLGSDRAWMAREHRLRIFCGFGALIGASGLIPIGDALCPDQLAAPLSPLGPTLDQCRESLGGIALVPFVVPGGLVALWAGAAIASLLASPRQPNRGPDRPAGMHTTLSWVAIGLACAAATADLAETMPHRMAIAQASSGWTVLHAPVAFLAAFFALAVTPSDSLLARGSNLLGWLLVTVVFFGGWTIPGPPVHALPHVAWVAIGPVVLGGKAAALAILARYAAFKLPARIESETVSLWCVVLAIAGVMIAVVF